MVFQIANVCLQTASTLVRESEKRESERARESDILSHWHIVSGNHRGQCSVSISVQSKAWRSGNFKTTLYQSGKLDLLAYRRKTEKKKKQTKEGKRTAAIKRLSDRKTESGSRTLCAVLEPMFIPSTCPVWTYTISYPSCCLHNAA